MHKKTKTQKMP